jgi:alanine dehydrogenase
MTLLLSQADVDGLLDLPGAMEATRQALREQAADAVTAVPPRHINVPRGALRVVSGALHQSRRMGVRLGPAAGFVDVSGGDHMVALLWDSESGDLLSVMAYPFSRLRTGGTIGVATELLAREDARTVGMIGTGRNALSLLQAACQVRPVERIRVHSRNAERREAFAARAQAALGVPVEATAEAAARRPRPCATRRSSTWRRTRWRPSCTPTGSRRARSSAAWAAPARSTPRCTSRPSASSSATANTRKSTSTWAATPINC